MKINISREIRSYNLTSDKKMTYERLAGLTMPGEECSLKGKVRTLSRMNEGKSSHPDMELVWRIATTLKITIDQLLQNETNKL